jgi:ribosome-associated translation inhibitor RaiA
MRLNVQHLNIRAPGELLPWVEKQILALGETRQIDEANIRLVRHEDASPAYQVNVHLVTPGPDVFVEARDHTVRGAFTKVMTELREQIALRASKRSERRRSNLCEPPHRAQSAKSARRRA